MIYSDGFKARMVKRMAGPEGISATALSKEVGITQPMLSRWLRAARSVGGMSNSKSGDDQGPRRKSWSVEDKMRILAETAALTDDELGAYLRREGVHEATLHEWKEAAASGLSAASAPKRSKKSPEAKKITALERELRRKDAALAEMAALITLQKKARAIWGDGDDDTVTRSET